MRKRKVYYENMDVFEVYRLVCSGKLAKFPDNYLDEDSAKDLVIHIIIDTLKYTRGDVCAKFNFDMLSDYYLRGVRNVFKNIPEAVEYIFNSDVYKDNPIQPWELNKVGNSFWEDEQNRIDFIKWVAKKEGIDIFNIKEAKRITAVMINNYGGSRALKNANGLFLLISAVPGVEYKEWQFVKINHWTQEKAIAAVKWLIEEKLKWNRDQVVSNICAKVFYENDLGGLLSKFFFNSPAQALKITYPDEYTDEELLAGLNKRRLEARMKKRK